jgi:hypothetical protein
LHSANLIVGDKLNLYGHFTCSLGEAFPIQPTTVKGQVSGSLPMHFISLFN